MDLEAKSQMVSKLMRISGLQELFLDLELDFFLINLKN
jgi:hypothetical protein